MRVERFYTAHKSSPYEGVTFRSLVCEAGPSSSLTNFELPAAWSASAGELLASHCAVPDGIPVRLKPVAEPDVPKWLWRHEPDKAALVDLRGQHRTRGESGARQIFDRIAGGLAYQGWKGGYFDSDADARAFFDEVIALLCLQLASPEIAMWRSLGVWWAYGIPTAAVGTCCADHKTGALAAAGPAHLPPVGAFITDADSPIELWRREATLLASGVGMGTNVSRLNTDGKATLLELLRFGDQAASLFGDADRPYPPGRTVVVDADHPETPAFADWKRHEWQNASAGYTGAAITQRHVTAIVDACRSEDGVARTDPARNPRLCFAIAAARQAMVPDRIIEHAIALVEQGQPVRAEDLVASPNEYRMLRTIPGQDVSQLIRASDEMLAPGTSKSSGETEERSIIDSVASAAWSTGGIGILFASALDAWNTCPRDGRIRAVAGDQDFVFLDETACGRAMLNVAGFLGPQGFDVAGFSHATRIMTVALDIAITMTGLPTPRMARRTWNFRPIGLGLTNLAGALISQAVPYDSEEGRAFCAASAALMTGVAYATSAEMAEEMGPFPAFAANRDSMLRVISNHLRSAPDAETGCGASRWNSVPLQQTLAGAASAALQTALSRAATYGTRNAHVTLISPAEAESVLLDCATCGIAPAAGLVKYERLPGAGFRKSVLGVVAEGLERLGYGETARTAILRHIAGHQTLAGAPGVNHEHLLRRGFTREAIGLVEAALDGAPDIRFAFDRWTLGDAFCAGMLGFSAEALDAPAFDMLTALGFSEAAIEAANTWCCGADTVEGAPYIEPDHLAPFDCARPLGDRGRRSVSLFSQIRMMAAVQPYLSGGIGLALTLSPSTSIDEVRNAMLLARQLKLKSITFKRDLNAFGESCGYLASGLAADMPRGGRISAIQGERANISGQEQVHASGGTRPESEPRVSEALAIARVAKAYRKSVGDKPAIPTKGHEIAIGWRESASTDAQASRQRSSHVARSAASVPSSADAVIEQRQV